MFCSKCGNKLEDNAVFCAKCGNKIANDLKTDAASKESGTTSKETDSHKAETSVNKAKPTEAPAIKKSDPSSLQKKDNNKIENKPSAPEVKEQIPEAKIKPEPAKKPSLIKKHLPKIIAAGVVLIAIVGGIIGFNYYQSEYTPEGKYNKGIEIYQYLCSYNSYNDNDFSIDSVCMDKLSEGLQLFTDAGSYLDAKLYAQDFKIAQDLYKTQGD